MSVRVPEVDRAGTGDALARRGCPGWMKWLLVLSLAANLAVVGIVTGRSLRDEPPRPRGTERVIESIIGMVPEERRELAAAHFAEIRGQLDADNEVRRARLGDVVAAIRAEPFDGAALDAALDAMFDRRSSGRSLVRERLVSLLAQLTAAERAIFAERFQERLDRRR